MPKCSRIITALLLFVIAVSPLASAKEKYLKASPVRFDRDGEKWAQKTLKKLSLEEKVGQIFMIWARVTFVNFDSPEYKQLRNTINKYHIGAIAVSVPTDGPFLLRNQPYEAAMLTNQLQRDSKLPLIMAADFERGVSMRLYGTTVFPHAMAFGAAGKPEFAQQFGRITAEESRAIGIHWNFFPVADVNSNPINPIINTRAFGEDPTQVGELVAAYIKGAHEAGMLTTAKHFPGHGDTATDSHLGLAKVDHDAQTVNTLDLPPFQKAIDAGVDSVMVAHVTIPALEPDPNRVATTSPRIVTELLKQQMKFKGVVVTDALDMNGLMRIYANDPNPSGAAAVAALKAGNDMILIPHDLDGATRGVIEAVKKGEIPQKQIDESVLKVLRAKAAVGLNKAHLVDVEQVGHLVSKPDNLAVGQQVADAAITVVRDNGQAFPLKAVIRGTSHEASPYTRVEQTANRVLAVIFSDDVRSESGRIFERQLRLRVPDARIVYVDPRIAAAMTEPVLAMVQEATQVIVPVYVIPTAGKVVKAGNELKNTVGLQDATATLLHRILEVAGPRTTVVAMGNPYVGSDFPEMQNYICTFSNATVSELSAVKALFGEIPVNGHLPVSIPAIAQRGEGITRPQVLQGVKANAEAKSNANP